MLENFQIEDLAAAPYSTAASMCGKVDYSLIPSLILISPARWFILIVTYFLIVSLQ
jgi:hypothetical protein